MQNGADIVKDQTGAAFHPPSSVHVTEAEISVEAIKFGKHSGPEGSSSAVGDASTVKPVDDSSQAISLSQKGSKNDTSTSPDTSMPDKTDKHQESGEKRNGEGQGERTAEEIKESSGMEEELLVSEDEPMEEGLVDNIGADDAVMVEPYMQPLTKPNGNNADPPKKKRGPGRPRKNPEDKVKKKSGRPRKSAVAEIPKPVETAPSASTGATANSAPNPEAEVDLFTFVSGKTSEPIQLSAVSSVVSGSEGSAVSLDGEAHGNENMPEENSQDIGTTEVKKLLKSKLLKTTSPNSEKTRKRKASSEKESPVKARKVSPRQPAQDSSSLQKKQDMIDFLDATEKMLPEQEGPGQLEIQGVAAGVQFTDDAIATALMAKGPCLDLDEDEPLLPLSPSQLSPLGAKKGKRKYTKKEHPKKKSPRSPENLKSLAEIATVSKSFEALHTSDTNDGVDTGIDIPSVPAISGQPGVKKPAKVGRPRKKYKTKNSLAALKARLVVQQARLEEVVLDVHNGEMIDQNNESVDVSADTSGNPSQPVVDGASSNIVHSSHKGLKLTARRRLSKVSSKPKKKKFHKWNKKKKHSPAVLLRIANQVQALQAAQEFARLEAADQELLPAANLNPEGHLYAEGNPYPGGNPYSEQVVPVENVPMVPRVKRTYNKRKGYTNLKKYKKTFGLDPGVAGFMVEHSANGTNTAANPPRMQIAKRGRKKGFGGKTKKTSPIVQLSPLAVKNDLGGDSAPDPFSADQIDCHNDDPPVLTKISIIDPNQTVSTSSRSALPTPYNPDLNYGDQHSDLSTSSSKRSYLKPKQAVEFAKDTGAVSLKNILPGRRKVELKKFALMTKPGAYSKIARGQGDRKGVGHGFNKGYRKGLNFARPVSEHDADKPETSTATPYPDCVSSDQYVVGSPRQTSPHTSSPVFNPQGRSLYDKTPTSTSQSRPRETHGPRDRLQSHEVFSSDDNNQTPLSHQHRPRERQDSRGQPNIHRQSSGGHKHSFSEDNDPPSSSERNSNRSHADSPNRKGMIGNTVGAVISQLFGDEIPRLTPGSGYVINVRLDVERKEATGTKKSHKNVSTQEDLDGAELRRHSSLHSTSKEKSTHVSSTVNSYTRKSQSSEPQPSTSSAPDDSFPRETTRPRISDVDLCAMLEERISTRQGLRVDVRDNLLDNIKHVERVLKESS